MHFWPCLRVEISLDVEIDVLFAVIWRQMSSGSDRLWCGVVWLMRTEIQRDLLPHSSG